MSWHLDSELPGCQLGLSWVSEATDPGRDTEGGPGKAFGWERGASRLRRFSCALSLVLHAWDADDAWIPTDSRLGHRIPIAHAVSLLPDTVHASAH